MQIAKASSNPLATAIIEKAKAILGAADSDYKVVLGGNTTLQVKGKGFLRYADLVDVQGAIETIFKHNKDINDLVKALNALMICGASPGPA